jgi:hypothetical protein
MGKSQTLAIHLTAIDMAQAVSCVYSVFGKGASKKFSMMILWRHH